MVVLLYSPRFGIDFRVVYGVLDLQMAEIGTPEAFNDVEGIAVRAAAAGKIGSIVEAICINYQRVAVPFSDGVPPPRGIGIFGKLASIHEDLSIGGAEFVKNGHRSSGRKDLEWLHAGKPGKVKRQTLRVREVFFDLPLQSFSLRRENDVFR